MVNLHVFLRVVSDNATRMVYVRGFILMEDTLTWNMNNDNSQVQSSTALVGWDGSISLW